MRKVPDESVHQRDFADVRTTTGEEIELARGDFHIRDIWHRPLRIRRIKRASRKRSTGIKPPDGVPDR